MFATSTRGSIWPARLSYLAAGLFTAASTGTNLIYGWSKGADTASSLVWAAVSLAVSVVFALSWPAFIVSLDRRQWARAAMVLIALIMTGTYSVIAALGSASGGRVYAALSETVASEARKNTQAAYDKATTDLAALKPTRPLAELEALVAVPAPCRIVVNLQGRQTICAHSTSLTAELGRAKRRAELEAKIEAARLELSAPATRQANSDAAALAGYFGTLGWKIEADTLNKLLALLAVLVIELGGGASLAVGTALADRSELAGMAREAGGSLPGTLPATLIINPLPAHARNSSPAGTGALAGTLPSGVSSGARQRLLNMLSGGQGVLRGCQAELGRALGVSRARVRQLLDELATAGLIRVRTSSTGTIVSLVGPIEHRAIVH